MANTRQLAWNVFEVIRLHVLEGIIENPITKKQLCKYVAKYGNAYDKRSCNTYITCMTDNEWLKEMTDNVFEIDEKAIMRNEDVETEKARARSKSREIYADRQTDREE